MTRLVPDWEIRITNFGLGYILMCLVVAIAATNTGNNGLYLVLAGDARRRWSFRASLSRRNVRAVSLRDRDRRARSSRRGRPGSASGSRTGCAPGPRRRSSSSTRPCPGPSGSIRLRAGETREIVRRGRFPAARRRTGTPDAGLLSRFPLGLFRKYRRARLRREIVVYPPPEAVPVPEIPAEDSRGGRPHPRSRGGGSDIRTLREFSPGDDPRDLHWKQSARMRRLDRPRARGRARPRPRSWRSTTRFRRRPTRASLERFERAVARCAGAGAAAALAGRGGRLPRPRREGRRAQRLGPAPPDSRRPRAPRAVAPGERAATSRRCAAATCGGSSREPAGAMPAGLRAPTCSALAPAAFLAPLPLLWTDGCQPQCARRLRAAPSASSGGGRARGRPVRLSDAVMNASGLAYFAWLVSSSARVCARACCRSVAHLLLFTALAKLASLKRPSEARLALLVIFLLTLASASSSTHVSSILYFAADGLDRLPDARSCSPFSPTSTRRPPDRVLAAIPTAGLSAAALLGGIACAAPLFFAAAPPAQPVRRGAVPRGRRLRPRADVGPRGPAVLRGGQAERPRGPAAVARRRPVVPAAMLRLREAVFTEYLDGVWTRDPRVGTRRGDVPAHRGIAVRRGREDGVGRHGGP